MQLRQSGPNTLRDNRTEGDIEKYGTFTVIRREIRPVLYWTLASFENQVVRLDQPTLSATLLMNVSRLARLPNSHRNRLSSTPSFCQSNHWPKVSTSLMRVDHTQANVFRVYGESSSDEDTSIDVSPLVSKDTLHTFDQSRGMLDTLVFGRRLWLVAMGSDRKKYG